jgi:hypothetical protein
MVCDAIRQVTDIFSSNKRRRRELEIISKEIRLASLLSTKAKDLVTKHPPYT